MRVAMLRCALLALTLCSWLALLPRTAFAQAAPQTEAMVNPGESLRVSLLTFAPGETYWQRFGHNAILLENTVTGANAVYNYGMFDFFQKNFFLNFARGHMVYRLDADTLERTLQVYAYEGRWVYQQVLNLDAAQRLQLAAFLDHNARPENRDYRYDYFRDNCSTRVRDALDRTLGGALATSLKAQPVAVTYRSEATRLIRPILPLALGMDAIMGPAGDAPITRWEQSYVPEVFMQAVAEQRIGGQPLVVESRYLLANANSPVAPTEPLHWTGAAFAIGMTLALLLAWLAHGHSGWGFALVAAPLLLVMGLGGSFMLAAWTLTEHWSMAANQNLLLFSPLALLLLPAVWRRARPRTAPGTLLRGLSWTMLLGALVALLPGGQHNAPWLALWLPVHLALAYGLMHRAREASY